MCGIKKREPKEGSPYNHLGIEFEFHLDRETGRKMQDELATLPLNEVMMLHYEDIRPLWDGQRVMAWEATLLTLEDNFIGDLKEMLVFIQKWGGSVDELCGLHVHIDCRHRTMSHVARELGARKNEIFEFCAPDRRTNETCCSWSFTAAGREGYKTVECRAMEANFDLERISSYIGKLVGIAKGVPVHDLPKYTMKVVRPALAVAAV